MTNDLTTVPPGLTPEAWCEWLRRFAEHHEGRAKIKDLYKPNTDYSKRQRDLAARNRTAADEIERRVKSD